MGVAQIDNPALAFDSAGQNNYAVLPRLVMNFPVGTTVVANTLVILTYSSTTAEYTIAPAGALAANIVGVATAAGIPGAIVPVVVTGQAACNSSASLATGVVVSSSSSGWLAAGSVTAAGIGQNCGFMLATVGTGATGQVWVGKGS